MLALLVLVIFAVNIAVQYGLTHISANRAIVIYLFELVVTAISAWLLAGEVLELREWIGGSMIVAAGLLSDRLGHQPAGATSGYSTKAVARPGRRLSEAGARQPFFCMLATTVVKMPPRT